jgi:hypothetical protein
MPTGNIIRSVRQTVLRKAISHLLCNRFDTLHGQRIRPGTASIICSSGLMTPPTAWALD